MGQLDIYNKQNLANLLKASGISLAEFQKPNNQYYLFLNHKLRQYEIVKFNPREDQLKLIWRECLQMSLPLWMKSYDDFSKSKRIKLREIIWERHPHDGCYFESYTYPWLTLTRGDY